MFSLLKVYSSPDKLLSLSLQKKVYDKRPGLVQHSRNPSYAESIGRRIIVWRWFWGWTPVLCHWAIFLAQFEKNMNRSPACVVELKEYSRRARENCLGLQICGTRDRCVTSTVNIFGRIGHCWVCHILSRTCSCLWRRCTFFPFFALFFGSTGA
jgi:hypothetical protein